MSTIAKLPKTPAVKPTTTCTPENTKYFPDGYRPNPFNHREKNSSQEEAEEWGMKLMARSLSDYLSKGKRLFKERVFKHSYPIAPYLTRQPFVNSELNQTDCIKGFDYLRNDKEDPSNQNTFGKAFLGAHNMYGSKSYDSKQKQDLINTFLSRLSYLQKVDPEKADALVKLYSDSIEATERSIDLPRTFANKLDELDGKQDGKLTFSAIMGEKAAQEFGR